MKPLALISMMSASLLALSSPVSSAHADEGREARISFHKGASSADTEGTIKGYNYVDYLLNVRAGQVLSISLTTSHSATYFNLIEPDQTDVAIFVGSSSGNQYEGVTSKNGDYRIRVYMMRAAARRGEVAKYRLETSVAGASNLPLQPGDAIVPGTNFHATGTIRCHLGSGAMRDCDFGVHRTGGGNGSVTITRPGGGTRTVLFEKGKAVGYDFNHADPGAFSTWRQNDETVVHIGDETYFLFDAIIWGG